MNTTILEKVNANKYTENDKVRRKNRRMAQKDNEMMQKLGRAILETRLETEISNLFSNISVKARSIKETLKKQKSDILVESPDKN